MSDYLYVIRSTSGGSVKLGKATDLKKRIATLQTGSSTRLEFVWTAKGDGDTAEKTLHRHFASKRGVGEWFNLSPEDIMSIPALASRFTVSATVYPAMKVIAEQTKEAQKAAEWAALTPEQQAQFTALAAKVEAERQERLFFENAKREAATRKAIKEEEERELWVQRTRELEAAQKVEDRLRAFNQIMVGVAVLIVVVGVLFAWTVHQDRAYAARTTPSPEVGCHIAAAPSSTDVYLQTAHVIKDQSDGFCAEMGGTQYR